MNRAHERPRLLPHDGKLSSVFADRLPAGEQDGLKLLKDGSVFTCPGAGVDSIRYPSAKATSIIFGAGMSLDSLMLRYKGAQHPGSHTCHSGAPPDSPSRTIRCGILP